MRNTNIRPWIAWQFSATEWPLGAWLWNAHEWDFGGSGCSSLENDLVSNCRIPEMTYKWWQKTDGVTVFCTNKCTFEQHNASGHYMRGNTKILKLRNNPRLTAASTTLSTKGQNIGCSIHVITFTCLRCAPAGRGIDRIASFSVPFLWCLRKCLFGMH